MIPALLLLLLPTAASQYFQYGIQIRTVSTKKPDSYYSDASLSLSGRQGSVNLGRFDSLVRTLNLAEPEQLINDQFQKSTTDTFMVSTAVDIGEVRCVVLTTPTAAWQDGWLVDWVKVTWDADLDGRHMYNTQSTWITSDTYGVASLEVCVQGREMYKIAIGMVTHLTSHTGSVRFKVTVHGRRGTETRTGFLDSPYYGEEQMAEDNAFEVRDLRDVGELKCVVLKVEGGDTWTFMWIGVHMDEGLSRPNIKYFYNEKLVVLSGDTRHGVAELRLCL